MSKPHPYRLLSSLLFFVSVHSAYGAQKKSFLVKEEEKYNEHGINSYSLEEHTNKFWEAIKRKKFDKVEEIMNSSTGIINLSQTNKNGLTPLHIVIKEGNPELAELARLFIAEGAPLEQVDVDPEKGFGWTPLQYAARYDKEGKIARLLLEKGADPLHKESGAYEKTALHLAARYDNPKVFSLILSSLAEKEANKKKVKGPQQKEVVLQILDNNDETPLHMAAEHSPKIVELLLEVLPKRDEEINQQNKWGWTALNYAVCSQNSEKLKTVERLLDAGLDPNTIDSKGNTLLYYAVCIQNSEKSKIVERLLDAGLNPNAMDDKGNTPLYYATQNDDPETIKLLLDHGADPILNEAPEPALD